MREAGAFIPPAPSLHGAHGLPEPLSRRSQLLSNSSRQNNSLSLWTANYFLPLPGNWYFRPGAI